MSADALKINKFTAIIDDIAEFSLCSDLCAYAKGKPERDSWNLSSRTSVMRCCGHAKLRMNSSAERIHV